MNTLPPGQYQVNTWPVLTVGTDPKINLKNWKLTISGEVKNPISFTWDEFLMLPCVEIISDVHCVTTWSLLGSTWKGVLFSEILKIVVPTPNAKYVLQKSNDSIGYSTGTDLRNLSDEKTILAYERNNEPISTKHGGPMRLITSQIYLYKSAKWLKELEFLSSPKMGFWEERGYSEQANPLKEQRYSSDDN